MSRVPSHLDAFVRGMRRRAGLWGVFESIGVGLALGAAVGIVPVGLKIWADGDGRIIALVALAAGAAAGLVYGIARWPSVLSVAMMADRQLGLNELLATGLSVGGSTDPWAQRVVAQANGSAAQLHRRELRLHRLGARAWGGIAMLAAGVVVLASLSTTPPDSQVAGGQGSTDRPDAPAVEVAGRATRPPPGVEGVSKDGSAIPLADPTGAIEGSSPGSDSGARAAMGRGGGEARSPAGLAIPPDVIAAPSQAELGDTPGSGDGRASPASDGATGPTAGRVTGGSAAPARRPLDPATMRPTRDNAPIGLDAIPDAYHDVVRFYFDAADR